MQNYIVKFMTDTTVSAKNEGDAMYKALKEIKKLVFKYQIQGVFDIEVKNE